jgi:uncharacterized protein
VTQVCFSLNNLGDLPLWRAVLAEVGLTPPLPFIEILWDNYCHLDPYELRDLLAPLSPRVSFHVMMSKFLQRTGDELHSFLRRLRVHARVVQPVRVSDHLARFRLGRLNTSLPLEMAYDRRELRHTAERVKRYQDWIGQQLLLENYASTDPQGARQIEFVSAVQERTGCGLLFDVSNAVVAQLNGILPLAAWLDHLAGAGGEVHGHVGGYRLGRSGRIYHDTHDSPVSRETVMALWRVNGRAPLASLCYERDYNKSVTALARDLRLVVAAVGPRVPARARAAAAAGARA